MRKSVILASLATVSSVAADGFPQRPQSCKLVSTAQHSDCEVENRYKCASGASHSYRIEFFEAEGLTNISHETADFLPENTIEADGSGLYMESATGLHPWDMLIAGESIQNLDGHMSLFGLQQPFAAEVRFLATGDAVELAGKTFQTIEGDMKFRLPNAGVEFGGRSVIAYQPDLELMIEIETSTDLGPSETTYVRELSLPGQPGFGDEFPKYGCINLSMNPTWLPEIAL